MSLAAGAKLGSYEILSPIGAGGMGEVWKAKDVRVDRTVALKVLPEDFLEGEERRARFVREAKLLASLNHPGIATIYSFEEISGRNVLSMELVEGEDLSVRIAAGPLSLEESLSLARQIAEALEAAHEKGIVHRDLKPANVKVTPDGRVKLLDFGLAKIFDAEGATSSPSISYSPTLTARGTAAGVILGTAAYMSPEQARGKPVDKRTDVWAFGCVLYEMLAGKRAFEGETVSDTLAAILRGEPDWSALRAPISSKVKELLHRCLQRDAKQRLRDIGDARIALEEEMAASTSASGYSPFEEKTAEPNPTVGRSASPEVSRGSRKSLSPVFPWVLAAAFAAAAGALALRARAPERGAVVRSTIALPAGVQFRSENGSVALSRDGKKLAFAAAAGGARPRIWVRSLDSFVAQALEGTEDATEPFFSPDGQNVAFFADRKLKRVPSAGGTVQTVCAVPDARGGTWGDSDVIVFSPAPFGGLRRVPASGGTPEELTPTVDKVTSDRVPAFVPGTDRVLFFHGSELNAKTNGIFAVDLASKKVTPVAAENGRPLVARGALLFPRPGGRIAVRRFDASSLKLSGEPVTLVEQAWFNFNRWTPNAAVSDTGLLVVEPLAASEKSRLTWLDLEGRTLGAVGEPGLINAAVVSPDGRRALVLKPDDTGGGAIWLLDLERGVASRFTPGYSYDPLLSADGKLAAYSDENGNLWVKAVDGLSEARKVVSYVSTNQRPTSFTPDGATLVLDRQTPEGWRVLSVPVAGGEPRLVTESHSSDQLGRVSPDGKWFAWLTDDTGRSEVYVMPWPKGERRQVSSTGAEFVFWMGTSGDLGWIRDGQLFASRIGATEPGPVRPLLGGPILATARAVAPSPDGTRILAGLPVGGAASGSLTLIANWPAELGGK